MLKWFVAFMCFALAGAGMAAVEIAGLPEKPAERYDFSWTMTAKGSLGGALALNVEMDKGQGYQVRWERDTLTWQAAGSKNPAVKASCPLPKGQPVILTIKRRPDTIAILKDHRLLLTAPAPSRGAGSFEFTGVPTGCEITEARYQEMGKPVFGDDFMRPEALQNKIDDIIPKADKNPWIEDATWHIAYFGKDDPDASTKDPVTGAAALIPWRLSLYAAYINTTTNGFWYQYTGVGPSWVVANRTQVYPTWDQYFVEAAVKPEYDSEVGLIAAYQDNKNYLQFLWKPVESAAKDRAQLIAVVNGERKVLAASQRGFEPSQWYTMRINLGWQTAQVLVDGELLMSAVNPGSIEGRVGLYGNGVDKPRRPSPDELTAAMYVTKDEVTGKVFNDAADAARTSSVILYDDVRVGEWINYQSTAAASPYPVDIMGNWKTNGEVSTATASGSLITGMTGGSRYSLATRLRLPERGSAALLLDLDGQGNGYSWVISPTGQKLYLLEKNARKQEVDSSTLGLAPGDWANLRAETDGPYLRLYFNNRLTLENYDDHRTSGRYGIQAFSRDVACTPLLMTVLEPLRPKKKMNDLFISDKWLVAWSSPEADWYPSFAPKAYVTPAGLPHDQVGAAAPLPTDQPGLYWHKGGHFHDLQAVISLTAEAISGQILHLASDYDGDGGYRVTLARGSKPNEFLAQLSRNKAVIGEYPFTLTAKSRLLFQRRGNFLILREQDLDAEDTSENPEVTADHPVFIYRDRAPLRAEMIGFTVTDAKLPAAKVGVDSDRIEDPFEYAPTGWISESGIWAVMARYSCQPQWNWFGGFGPYTPTVWNKTRLDGDQVVEAYMGIKMQYDNSSEEYAKRYRDVNMTICADGSHLNSGYSVIRAGHPNGRITTLLMRKGVVVAELPDPKQPKSDDQQWLLPPQGVGHRRWFATRIEKRGDILKVFIDNKLAMTYKDPDPIPGGYAGIWTFNNGVMIGRANLSAEKMSIGSPRAAAPLAVQENLPAQPVAQVTVNDAPVKISTFESGLDDCKERSGLTARLIRERVTDPTSGANTYLKVINMYPAGDFSATLVATARDLHVTPSLQFDYCFDTGARVNLYLHHKDTWYEFFLTGLPAQDPTVFTAGKVSAIADGQWHHFDADLSKLLADAIKKKENTADATDLSISEMIVADWSAGADARYYGFGNNYGGQALRFDNIAFVPALTGKVKVSWSLAGITSWKSALDTSPSGLGKTETNGTSETLTPRTGTSFYHLQGKDANGKWTPPLTIPLVVTGQ